MGKRIVRVIVTLLFAAIGISIAKLVLESRVVSSLGTETMIWLPVLEAVLAAALKRHMPRLAEKPAAAGVARERLALEHLHFLCLRAKQISPAPVLQLMLRPFHVDRPKRIGNQVTGDGYDGPERRDDSEAPETCAWIHLLPTCR